MIVRLSVFPTMLAVVLSGLMGCATAGPREAPPTTPDLTPISGQALSATGLQVLACVRQAWTAGTFDMVGDDGESRLVRFTCQGAEANVLFDALAQRSAAINSEWTQGSATYRSTERIEHSLYGVDLCRRQASPDQTGSADYQCQFNLNLGGFIR
jgi:hypothetical protein